MMSEKGRRPAAEWVPIGELEPWDKNPRKNDHKIPEAVASLRRFGFCAPLVAWTTRQMIVAGHARRKAMKRILEEDPLLEAAANRTLRESLTGPDFAHVPVRFREFSSMQEATAYALRDNNGIGEWDEEMLGAVLKDLGDTGAETTCLGWDDKEIEAMLAGAALEQAEGTLDITDTSSPEQAGSKQLRTIVFGEWCFTLSDEDAEVLEAKIKKYTEEQGTTHGFGALVATRV